MSTSIDKTAANLARRIRRFYVLLNEQRFAQCYRHIDPVVRAKAVSDTLQRYEEAAQEFVTHYGSIRVRAVEVQTHLDEPSVLYGGRDFAVGRTVWEDSTGSEHVFQERWVRDGQRWYTRSTGFVTPATA